MKNYAAFVGYGLGTLALCAALTLPAAPAPDRVDTIAAAGHDTAAAWRDRMRDRMHARLEQLAQRLQLAPSQREAWNAYTRTIESMFDMPLAPPATDADAATITRIRAERALRHAQKLAQLADATATLREVLDAGQREILDQAARRHRHARH